VLASWISQRRGSKERLAVDIPAMPDVMDGHLLEGLVDIINDPVVPNAYAISGLCANQPDGLAWERVSL